ncbi:uncharacterized protein LOC134542145 [Bacillus rossius redtenbacheri]|uniref:uncharacterized protein LOC134542145 n=1 Tax=Bacillus rossius redtenbacheri TaxID=93214 RepID=UPI002FDF0A6A
MSVAAAAVIVFGVLPLISSAPELRRFPRDGKTLVVDEKNSSEVATLEESGMLITADSRLQFSCADREDGAYADSSSSRIYYRCRGGRREARSCAAGREFSARTARCEPRGDPPPPCEALGDGLHADHASGCQQYFRQARVAGVVTTTQKYHIGDS